MVISEKWITIRVALDAITYALSQYRYREIDRATFLSRVEENLRELLPYHIVKEIVDKLEEEVDIKSSGELLTEIQEILIRGLIGVAT